MKKNIKLLTTFMLLFGIVLVPMMSSKADEVDMKSYIAFGADLKPNEKEKVMNLLDVSETDLSDYEVVQITNKEEHQYLGSYLSEKVIGTRALSSVKVEKGEEGSGIGVDTENITYCSSGMYCNALITAGVKDAMITVAGPFNISGTAALVGVMKAYSIMTGEEIDEKSVDAANNELVVTGSLGEDFGAEDAANFVAAAKQKVVSGNLSSKEDIMNVIDEVETSMEMNLSDKQKEQVYQVLDKIKDLEIDVDTLKEQAEDIYNKIADLGIDMEVAEGFFEKIGSFFADLGEKISTFFSNFFK